ncbi:DUF1641 domain-containing protein [Candidatus Magnetominusculus dajiuhuensis]|uniref:DUF1641 domain-containing protein n=1 Tax=Candidatus Magnetominusculus dajiuhuensis TaxID=3137712 RepID=UPI0019FEF273|nr:DUF1641 domain-containing protein [Nitrospirota bacterium]
MAKKTTPTNGTAASASEQMAMQMDELYGKYKILENFAGDVMPGIEKAIREINSTINDLRIRFERDETLQLLKSIGDNIPTFVELLKVMKAFKGFAEDVFPASDKMVKELTPAINTLRYAYEKDETLELLQKTGDSIPIFIKLIDFLMVFDKSGDLDFTLKTAFSKETEFMIKGMEKCAVRTMQQLIENPLKPGLKSIFAALKDPEVQKGFVLMTTFARNMPQCMLETVEEGGAKIKKK